MTSVSMPDRLTSDGKTFDSESANQFALGVVLLELSSSGVNGYEVLRALWQQSQFSRNTFIALTGREDVLQCIERRHLCILLVGRLSV